MAPLFSNREMRLLSAVCDTLIPSLTVDPDIDGFFARKASDLDVAAKLAILVEKAASPADAAQLKQGLMLLDFPLVNALFGGVNRSFIDMTLEERTRILQNWMTSRLGVRRKLISVLKRLASFIYYTTLDEDGCNRNWGAMSYPGPTHQPSKKPKTLQPLAINEDTLLETDVVIIGSGAGGGVVAGQLTAAGYDVIILEKGGYYAEQDFDGHEWRSQELMFEKGGLCVSEDLNVLILAGATLGGGTTINWTACLRTPQVVLDEWEQRFGVTGFTGKAYEKAMDAVSARIHVTTAESEANPRNAVLVRGGGNLGCTVDPLPRNVENCADCGFCGFGCAHGAKQTTMHTYLQDAQKRGARIAVQTTVHRVLLEDGKATGVEGHTRTADGRQVKLKVKARVVVSAAGSLQTPALLLRSGLHNTNIGRNLHLHPATGIFGFYEAPVKTWEGVMMSHFIADFNNMDGQGYGVTLESAPGHPGLTAISFPWKDGFTHKWMMQQYGHVANVLVLTRDRDGGQVCIDRHGEPYYRYSISKNDLEHLRRGVIEGIKIQRAAGAREIYAPVAAVGHYHADQGDAAFEAFLNRVSADPFHKYSFVVGSAHQLSSCRMGGNSALGALKPTGESYEVDNLFVADGSVLPSATGVNPMLTIMSVAHVIAGHIQAKLA
jgi:choline dehydrogenase-like flavoprotein